MPSPATITDLTARSFRPLTTAEQQVGGVLLEDAWTLILTHRPHVEERIADATFLAVVKQIQCAMVLRVVRNPDGLLSEQVDDYQYRRDSAMASGALYISDAELALLGNGDGFADGAWSIRQKPGYGSGYWSSSDTWVAL